MRVKRLAVGGLDVSRKATHVGKATAVPLPTLRPRFATRLVVCPECKAPIGESCRTASGARDTGYHVSRERIGARHLRELRELVAREATQLPGADVTGHATQDE